MEYRHLGNSGLKESSLAYGNWITHGSQIDQEQAVLCINAALDAGITTFDTADVYANTLAEQILGRALKGTRRESIELCIKVYWPTGPGKNDRGLSRKHIIESCHASLKRLGTEYIDLYQAHRYDYETPLEESLVAFDDLVRQGKVLYVGVSEWKTQEIKQALDIAQQMGLHRIVSNQPQYSMLWRVIEAEVVPLCEKEGIGQIVWSPLAQGVLSGKYLPGQPPPEGSRATDPDGSNFITHFLNDDILTKVQQLKPICEDINLSLAQTALAWVLQNNNVAAAIVGATHPKQIEENVGAVGVELSDEIKNRIDQVLKPVIKYDPALTQSPTTRP
jgi:aryl-alcohol dehydrogenase-like predicted oxidoreductase